MSNEPKFIFCDLDNTLISAEWNCPSPKRQRLNFGGSENYDALLRPGAHDLLHALRTEFSTRPVYMLTAATIDYAKGWNRVYDFKFADNEIYARDDTDMGMVDWDPVKFPVGKTFLIDDLPAEMPNSWRKAQFISKLGVYNHIKISGFWGHPNGGLKKEEIDKIVATIKNA